MKKLAPALGLDAHPVTRARVFPGGAIGDMATFVEKVRVTWPFLGDARAARMAHAYGTKLSEMLDGLSDASAMGRDFGAGLTEVELKWMRDREWARSAADALERRSKLGLHLTTPERMAVEEWWGAPAERS